MRPAAKVLLIDDEAGMLNTLVGILEDEGYVVSSYSRGKDAIEFLQTSEAATQIDLVISDIKLPDLCGLEILSYLKASQKLVPFIVITGFATVETAIDAMNQGAFAYHVKPLDINLILNSIHIALEQRRLLRENQELLQRVQQSEVKYRTLVEQARNGIFLADLESGRIIEVNAAMADLVGCSRECLLNSAVKDIHDQLEQGRIHALLNGSRKNKTGENYSLVFDRGTGERRFIDLSTSRIECQGRHLILGILRDITIEKISQEKLQENNRLISLGELAAGVAHEINNPLTTILGFSELLLREELPERIHGRLQTINGETRRAGKIVHDLLSFARRKQPAKRHLSVNAIVDTVLALKGNQLQLNNIKVTYLPAERLPCTMVDEHQLTQVLLNLITNAEQAMQTSNGCGELAIRTCSYEDRIRISVADSGPGIPPEILPRIFDPFFTTKGIGKGTGLGLSICHGIITEHGGRIWAESKLGSGVVFTIELPVMEDAGKTDEKQSDNDASLTLNKAVLVVDDEPQIRRFISDALSDIGCSVDQASNGEEAWQKLYNGQYDGIILDVRMPKMGGIELYQHIKERYKDLAKKVVFVTGDTSSLQPGNWIAEEATPVLCKPFTIKQIHAAVQSW